jgi:kynurenine formamidase
VFNKPLLLDIPKNMGEILAKEELIQYRDKIREADLLLIRSGTYQWKQQKPLEFASRGPALHSEAARYLMEEFPSLRAIGVDWLSIASPSFMPDGIYTHQYLLGRFHDHHLFIIEDLNLKDLHAKRLLRVFAFPLLVEGIDSAPATVVAEVTT